MQRAAHNLAEKIQTLSAEQIAEVEEFVESLSTHSSSRLLRQSGAVLSDPAFAAIWTNPEDDSYDSL